MKLLGCFSIVVGHYTDFLSATLLYLLLCRAEDLTGKGPGYALAEAGVEIIRTESQTLDGFIQALPPKEYVNKNQIGYRGELDYDCFVDTLIIQIVRLNFASTLFLSAAVFKMTSSSSPFLDSIFI